MIRNPKTGVAIREHRPERPPKPGCESSLRKGIFVLLAISALAAAGHGFAQEDNGSSDGLYTVPDSGASATAAQESTANRAAQSYLNSLDPQGEKYRHDLEKAEAIHKARVAANKANYLAGGNGSNASPWRPHLSERIWIAIWAGVGLVVSLAAGGYLWWSRLQTSRGNSTVLLTLTRGTAAKAAGTGTGRQEKPARRHAA